MAMTAPGAGLMPATEWMFIESPHIEKAKAGIRSFIKSSVSCILCSSKWEQVYPGGLDQTGNVVLHPAFSNSSKTGYVFEMSSSPRQPYSTTPLAAVQSRYHKEFIAPLRDESRFRYDWWEKNDADVWGDKEQVMISDPPNNRAVSAIVYKHPHTRDPKWQDSTVFFFGYQLGSAKGSMPRNEAVDVRSTRKLIAHEIDLGDLHDQLPFNSLEKMDNSDVMANLADITRNNNHTTYYKTTIWPNAADNLKRSFTYELGKGSIYFGQKCKMGVFWPWESIQKAYKRSFHQDIPLMDPNAGEITQFQPQNGAAPYGQAQGAGANTYNQYNQYNITMVNNSSQSTVSAPPPSQAHPYGYPPPPQQHQHHNPPPPLPPPPFQAPPPFSQMPMQPQWQQAAVSNSAYRPPPPARAALPAPKPAPPLPWQPQPSAQQNHYQPSAPPPSSSTAMVPAHTPQAPPHPPQYQGQYAPQPSGYPPTGQPMTHHQPPPTGMNPFQYLVGATPNSQTPRPPYHGQPAAQQNWNYPPPPPTPQNQAPYSQGQSNYTIPPQPPGSGYYSR